MNKNTFNNVGNNGHRLKTLRTLQEHQWIPTNATVSKDSDMVLQWWSMRIFFKVFERNEEICIKTNIA